MSTNHRVLTVLAFVVVVLLVAACQPAPTPTPEPAPTRAVIIVVVTPTPEGAPPAPVPTRITGAGPGGCTLKATYIADVTIPDGTVLQPSTPFVKTWRVRNDGTCTWDAGYRLIFSSGAQMGGPSSAPIPTAQAGQTIDVSVNLVSPSSPGDYAGVWTFQADNGATFGGLTVVIRVSGPPTPTPVIPSTDPWDGTWQSTYGDINMVQNGNLVTGSYPGGQLSGYVSGNLVSGTYQESSGVSGTFDFWIEGNHQQWHGNYDKVGAWCGHRPGVPDLSPCGVASWYGTWTTACSVTAFLCGDLVLSQSGDTVNGTFASGIGRVDGQVYETNLSGTVTVYPGGPNQLVTDFSLNMFSNGVQFDGTASGGRVVWCGARYGAAMPVCAMPF